MYCNWFVVVNFQYISSLVSLFVSSPMWLHQMLYHILMLIRLKFILICFIVCVQMSWVSTLVLWFQWWKKCEWAPVALWCWWLTAWVHHSWTTSSTNRLRSGGSKTFTALLPWQVHGEEQSRLLRWLADNMFEEKSCRQFFYYDFISLYYLSQYFIGQVYAAGDNLGSILSGLTLRTQQRTNPSLAFLLPDPELWKDEVLVVTPSRNYTIHDMKEYLRYSSSPAVPLFREYNIFLLCHEYTCVYCL